jgi:hypothetical protein
VPLGYRLQLWHGAIATLLLPWACATGVSGDDDPSAATTGGGGTSSASGNNGGSTGGTSTTGGNGSSTSTAGGSGSTGGSSANGGSGAQGGGGPSCGDANCQSPESCTTCAQDCGCCVNTANCDGNFQNGCECTSVSCCGNSCETQHSNGLGQLYYDCVSLATYDTTQATKAATAWPTAGTILSASCTGPGQNSVICKQGTASCACWNYSGSNVGKVHQNLQDNTCYCPSSTDPTWN